MFLLKVNYFTLPKDGSTLWYILNVKTTYFGIKSYRTSVTYFNLIFEAYHTRTVPLTQAHSQPKMFRKARANYGGTKFFVYSDVNEGIKYLYRGTYNGKQASTVFLRIHNGIQTQSSGVQSQSMGVWGEAPCRRRQ